MGKIPKKVVVISVVCMLAVAAMFSVSIAFAERGNDNSIIVILTDIINALTGVKSTVDKGPQVVTYSGNFVLQKGVAPGVYYIDWAMLGTQTNRDRAADFRLTFMAYTTSAGPQGDFTAASGDTLGVVFAFGNVASQNKVKLVDAEIVGEPTETSFTGSYMTMYCEVAAPMEKVVTIYYSYTVTTSADAVVTLTHFTAPSPVT